MAVTPSLASTTKRMRSAVCMAMSASVATASPKLSSSVAPMPPVSMSVQGELLMLQGADMRSRVTPGWSCTMAILRPARRLKRADFPTFGRPTMATVGIL